MRLLLLLPLALRLSAADTYIFVDDSAIARKQGVERVLHQGKKLAKPVLEPERPWEGRRVYTYGSVHFDPAQGIFRMWYNARIRQETAAGFEDAKLKGADLVLHATSRDGIHWERSNAGIYKFNGSTANNVVHHFHSPSIVVDDGDPAKRYKMFGWGRIFKGYSTAVSADGIHWQDSPGNPVIRSSDTTTMTRNPATGEFMAYHKWPAEVRGFKRRSIWLATSKDFTNWSKPELVLAPDEQDDEWVAGPKQRTEMYDMSAFPYAGQFLGLVAMFHIQQQKSSEELGKPFSASEPPSPVDGPIDIQLVTSKDGHRWARSAERKPVIALGAPGSYDAGCILGVSNPVVYKDEIWVYYTAITTTHGGDLPAKRISIGRASWRLDGFASLHAKDGFIETVPLPLDGNRVQVNARGRVDLEVIGADGRPVAGFAKSDFESLSGDGIRQIARWKGGDRLPQPAKSLRVFLKNADLFAIRLEK